MPPLLKFLTAKNDLILSRYECSLQAPLKCRPARRPLAIFLKNKPFLAETLKAKLETLEARLRPVEHLDKEVEIECRSSRTCD